MLCSLLVRLLNRPVVCGNVLLAINAAGDAAAGEAPGEGFGYGPSGKDQR